MTPWAGILLIFIGLTTASVRGHTLPISYLTIVADKEYVHLELTINPFELNCASEFDQNKDRLLDSTELASAEKLLADRILPHLKLKADGKELVAETSGFSGNPGDHHLTLRAHYRCHDLGALVLESDLQNITTASHLSEVTFLQNGVRQLARLDSQTQTAAFQIKTEKTETAAALEQTQASTGFVIVLLLGAIPAIAVFITLLMFAPKQLREQSAEH